MRKRIIKAKSSKKQPRQHAVPQNGLRSFANDRFPIIAAFLLVAVLGIYLLSNSKAATLAVASEAESGTLSGNATIVSDANASGGHAIKFGNSSTTTGQICTNPVFTSSAQQGRWPSSGNPYVNNNVWNTSEAGPQTIYVCGLNSFYIVANQPDLANDRGSIKSYPSVCNCGLSNSKPLSSYTTISSSFAESIPQMGEWNAAYDIFLANGTEIMIDNETHNHPPQDGQAVTIDGIAYHALRDGTDFIVLGMDNFKKSGTLNFIPIFQWLESQGWVKPTDALDMWGYGVEISYTESSPGVAGPERFDITNWSLTAN